VSIFCGLEGVDVVVWLRFCGLVMGFFLWSYSCRSAEGEDCRGGSELWESISGENRETVGDLVGYWADFVGSLPNCFL
jgi:hypothetical protein